MDQNSGLPSVQVDKDVFALAAHRCDPRCDRESREGRAIDRTGQAQTLATGPHRLDARTQQARPQRAYDCLDFGQLGHGYFPGLALLMSSGPKASAKRANSATE